MQRRGGGGSADIWGRDGRWGPPGAGAFVSQAGVTEEMRERIGITRAEEKHMEGERHGRRETWDEEDAGGGRRGRRKGTQWEGDAGGSPCNPHRLSWLH